MEKRPEELLSVSIVIPTYNRADLVGRAVASAIAGCAAGDEVIVIDDGSTDQTAEALVLYRDRIRYVRTENRGCGNARNEGVKRARNHLVAFLDSDDEWMPYTLGLQRAFMQARPDVLFCFSDFCTSYISGQVKRKHLISWHNDPRDWEEILGAGFLFSSIAPLPSGCEDFHVYVGDLSLPQMVTNYVFTSSLVVRREMAGEALRFAEDLRIHEDYACFCRLARKGPAAYMECETAWQHGHGGPRISDADIMSRATNHITILERVWGGDKDFLNQHGRHYQKAVAAQRLIKARELLSLRRTREARAELRLAGESPLSLRVLALLPSPIMQGLMTMRSVFRRMLRRK